MQAVGVLQMRYGGITVGLLGERLVARITEDHTPYPLVPRQDGGMHPHVPTHPSVSSDHASKMGRK